MGDGWRIRGGAAEVNAIESGVMMVSEVVMLQHFTASAVYR